MAKGNFPVSSPPDDEPDWLRDDQPASIHDVLKGDTPSVPAQGPYTWGDTPTTPQPGPAIHRTIIAVMREVLYVGKTGYNETQKYNFRGIDAAVNALGPAMRKHGLFVVPLNTEITYRDTLTTQDKKTREVTVMATYRFFAEDGSFLDARVPGESLDTSDKGSAKAMSVAFRILLLQVFALPTDEPTTDDTGQYHTRGGSKGMSKFERDAGRALLAIPTAEQRAAAGSVLMGAAFQQALDFKACLEEHDAWGQPVSGEDGPVWGEVFGARCAAEIAAADIGPELTEMWQRMKAADELPRMVGDKALGVLVKERAEEIRTRNAKALDTIMGQIQAATGQDELDGPVADSIAWAFNQQRITDEEALTLARVSSERRAKLPAVAPAAEDEQDSAEDSVPNVQGDEASYAVESEIVYGAASAPARKPSRGAPQGEQAAYEVGA